ncbi:hypothetical protein NQ314_004147 [Rhamnusium bicolor]|uniref:Uncharacterized protein n=1 Tax=Rhamnusium bicolor TaxID=1586634 RepID=A0AAV8ZK51_9CUCU|nr:hypothetical protein NQ314_004147 [Rhamnusium bicolor]
MARNILVLNVTWLVNSAAHLYGNKPFDQFMLPVESTFVAFVAIGEGWHNYHHTFPWDYRAAELGSKYCATTYAIDFLAYFGLAYDLKSAPYNMIEKRALRTGDGTHSVFGIKKARIEGCKKAEEDIINEADNEKLYQIEENVVGKAKNFIPDVSHRAVTVQG